MRILSLLCLLALGACSSSSSPAETPAAPGPTGGHGEAHAPTSAPACQEIAKKCHDHDSAGGLPRECHLMGHSPKSTQEQCEAKRTACLEACAAHGQTHAH